MNRAAGFLRAAMFLAAIFTAPAAWAQNDMPTSLQLPVRVNLALRILDIVKIAETSGETSASLEYTARWHDPSIAFDPITFGSARRDFTGDDAKKKIAAIWTPDISLENRISTPRMQTTALSIFADGRVTLIERFDADFRIVNDLSAFPFDRQLLRFPFVSQRHSTEQVIFVIDDRDRELSTFADRLTASDWSGTSLHFAMATIYGWNARPFMRANAVLTVERAWPRYFLRIFVPFVAVLTVSLFILWTPRGTISDTIGITYSALLALAALSFTFEASFPGSMSVNSPIAFMISLGYFYLIFVLLVNLVLESGRLPGAARNPALTIELRAHARYVLPAIFTTVCVCTILRSLS